MKTAKYWIEKLELLPHPESGYYKEVYRSTEEVVAELLPLQRTGIRSINTAIYYLLEKEIFSAFHRIKSDEIWHFYDGKSIVIYVIDKKGKLEELLLDKNNPMQIVPKNTWFAAELKDKNSFALVGCTVAPGFDFEDFEMGERSRLLSEYPDHEILIERLTK